MKSWILLAFVPVAPILQLLGLPPIWVFVTGILGVGVLADWIRRATDQLARHTGPAVGGLLTVSLGSLAELLLALFVLARGAASTLHLSPTFLGVIVLALVGNVADIVSAVWFARQGRLGLVMSICIGSAIQVALVVAPLLVILSWLMGSPMTLVFTNPLDLFAIAGTAFIVNAITGDGETTWFEGVLLVGVYCLLGTAFFFA
jgi:Ca2+:H+ antiporter